MIIKLPQQILRATKYSLLGIYVQCLFVGVLCASDINAQQKSLNEIFLTADSKNGSPEDVFAFRRINETIHVETENKAAVTPAKEISRAQRSVAGRVIDQETNEGLPGVNVILKGTTTGTVTD